MYVLPPDAFLARLKISAVARRRAAVRLKCKWSRINICPKCSVSVSYGGYLPSVRSTRCRQPRDCYEHVCAYVHKRERKREKRACWTTLGLNRVNFNYTGLMLAGRRLWSIMELAEARLPENICLVGQIRYSFSLVYLTIRRKLQIDDVQGILFHVSLLRI